VTQPQRNQLNKPAEALTHDPARSPTLVTALANRFNLDTLCLGALRTPPSPDGRRKYARRCIHSPARRERPVRADVARDPVQASLGNSAGSESCTVQDPA
jgi:hypothetical protein